MSNMSCLLVYSFTCLQKSIYFYDISIAKVVPLPTSLLFT